MLIKTSNENKLLYRILLLFTLVSAIVIAMSIYSIQSLDSANQSIDSVYLSNVQVDKLAREILIPITNLRMLSMELVLAPNKTIISVLNKKIKSQINDVDRAISVWEKDLKSSAKIETELVLKEFSQIRIAWHNYKDSHETTADYVHSSIRVASFISVTQQEKIAYENLLTELHAYNHKKLEISKEVYSSAQEKSSIAYLTLLAAALTAVAVLISIMFVVHRMVRGYLISKRKYEQELSDAAVEANAANQAKSEFLANMSHEIRTPMNAVLGFTEILATMEKDSKKAHYINNIHTSGRALLNLINDILDLSKIEAGKLELQYTSVSLSSLFNEMVTVFEQKAVDKGLRFIVDNSPGIPEALLLDETRLRQILINLLGNSVKFTDSGHIRLSARIKYFDQPRSQVDLTIIVEDTGIGISKDQHKAVFSAFEQVEGQKTAKYGGTGLGLTITRRLVEMMGGEIVVESQLGSGTSFSVLIHGVEIAALDSLDAQRSETLNFEALRFKKALILITDDIDYNREMLTLYLRSFGFEFIYAENGRQAVEQANTHHPDLILMDMKMPEMNGFEASEMIKNNNTLKDVSIIAVTASALLQDEEEISRLCDGYLRKPVSRSDLTREIMKYLPYSIAENIDEK